LLAVQSFTLLGGSLASGSLSDRLGRRTAMVLGAAAVLQRAGCIPKGLLLQETQSGLTEVDVQTDLVTLVAPTPTFVAAPDAERLSRALRMEVRQPEIMQSGVRHLLVQAPSLEALTNAAPDMSALADLSREWGYVGVIPFCLTPGGSAFARCRMFAPGAGIPEDPATGSAAALFALYLHRHGMLPSGWEVLV
jgi:trans-2,3-dihydro-3-hydroxyanthranilate isomerase